jgi:hypothetical protein
MGTELARARICALRMRTGGTFDGYTRPLAISVGRRNHTDRDSVCDLDGLRKKEGCAHRDVRVSWSNRIVRLVNRRTLGGVD